MKLNVEYMGGPNNLVCGDYPEPGTLLGLIDPWGNYLGVVEAGSKRSYGPGGFEFVAQHPGPGYDINAGLDGAWEFEHKAGLTFLTWENEDPEPPPLPPEPPPPPPPEPPPPEWKWMSELMERLDRIIELLEEIAGG